MAKSYNSILTNVKQTYSDESIRANAVYQSRDNRNLASDVKPILTQPKPVLPKFQPKTSFGSVLDEYNTSLPGIGNQIAKNLAPERKQEIAQGTQRFFEKAPVQAGFMERFSLNSPVKSLERKIGTPIDISGAKDSIAFTMKNAPINRQGYRPEGQKKETDVSYYGIGEAAGTMAQFVLPYAGASGGIGSLTTKALPSLGKFGQGVVKSVATDLAVGLPLNTNIAFGKEGLRGTEAFKNIAKNTALDLVTGGFLEVAPMFLKSGKKVASKAEFDNLPPAEKTEVMSELERLAYESNVRKGKVAAQGDTLYSDPKGQTTNTLTPKQLPSPRVDKVKQVDEIMNQFTEWRKQNFGGSYGKMSSEDMGALKQLFKEDTGIDLDSTIASINSIGKMERPFMPDADIPQSPKAPKSYKGNPKPITKQAYTPKMQDKVIGIERGNQGTIAKVNEDGSYLVLFQNKATGNKALIKMQRNEFAPIENTIRNLEMQKLNPTLPRAPQPVPPQPLPQAPTKPVQPTLPQKGTEIPKEQQFAKNEDLRNSFSQAHGEKFEADYNNFIKETEDLPDVQTGASEFAQRITSKGVTRSKDVQRIADSAFKNSPDGRRWFKQTFEDNFYRSKGKYANETKTKLDKLHKDVVTDLGIKKGSKESAGVQWYGEGKRQRTSGKNKSTETTPYTLDDLQADFNYTMPNGKKAWENIVQAESKIRVEYMRYVDKINEALRKIYPNVEANVEKLQAKLAKTADPEARKAVLQEIEDATIGKRLQPRQDYFRHFQEQQQGFLVGLDNVINGATNIDPRLIGVSEFTKPNSKWTGFLQRRKDGDIYTEDAIGGLLEYIPQAEYKINIEPNIPVLRSVIKELKESTIQSRNANSFIDELMQITNDLAGKSSQWDRSILNFVGDERGRKALNFLSTISNRMRKNAVMGNFNSMIAQFFNLPNVVGYAKNPIDIADGFKTSIQASMGNAEAKALLDKSMFLKERYIDRSFRQFNTGILDNAENFFAWTMELGDKAIADGAWLTFYKQAIKNMDESSAILKADEMTRKSIGGRGIAEMPLSQKAKITKMIMPFQVEVRNAVNVLGDLGRAKDVGGIVGVFVTSYLLNETLKATTGREIGFNPIGTVQDSIQDGSNVVAGLAGNALSNYPGGSYIASGLAGTVGANSYQMQELFGENDPSRFGTGNIALQTWLKPAWNAANGQNIDLLKPVAATLPRFGGKQLERSIRGLQDMAVLPREQISSEGISAETQDFPASYSQSGRLRFPLEPNLPNYLTAPTLGTWSTKEGKDYIENERQPLGEKQTALIEQANKNGVSPIKLTKAYNEIKGLTKKEDVIFGLKRANLTTREINLILEQKGWKPIEGQ
jgi:hypothetical protein